MIPQRVGTLWEDFRWSWTKGERKAFDWGDELTTVQWAEKNIKLPPSITAFHGYWRCSLTPYAADVMNLWDDDSVRKTVKCWAPQTAKTLTSVIPILRKLSRGLGPALMVMSSETGLRRKFREEYIPLCKASPGLEDLLSTAREDLTSSTIRLVGDKARLDGAWATSLPGLKSFGYRYCLGDEVEDWPANVGGGGDPEALLDVRTQTYRRSGSHIELISSPGKESGQYAKMLGCQVVWVLFAKCPYCGCEQRLTWPDTESPFYPRWQFDGKADPDALESGHGARYLCAGEGCGAAWTDGDRDRAVRTGRWKSVDKQFLTNELWFDPFPEPPSVEPLRPLSVGTHLPAWYSGMVSLSKVAADFLRATRTPDPVERIEKLKTWTNNYPAHPWLENSKAAIEAEAFQRDGRPALQVPDWAVVLLLTADVQSYGLWYEVRAWDGERRSALVRYGLAARELEFEGRQGLPPHFPASGDFVALRRIYLEPYVSADGTEHQIAFGLVDSRYRGEEVFEFCRAMNTDPENPGRPLWPSQGRESLRGGQAAEVKKVDVYPGTTKAIPGGLWRVDVDTNRLKDALSLRLQVPAGDPGCWLLHAEAGGDYIQHYRSEAKDELTQTWKQRGSQPNHLWDCGVLQLAAVRVLEMQGLFSRLAAAPPVSSASPSPSPAAKERSKLW